MSWIDRLKITIIVCLSFVLGFIIVELGYRKIKGLDNETSDFTHRTMLYEFGKNFKNYVDFFKYYPNTSIRSLTLYSKTKPTKLSDLVIEYDYVIHTNNAGLVMQKDLKNSEEVIYVIGDSFTEGQGASPWFYKIEELRNNTNVKLVNLGILGTGPTQWKNLENYITQQFNLIVKGSVINIVPDDMERSTWVFKEQELKCLWTLFCDYTGGFQGFNFKDSDDNNKIKMSVLTTLINNPFNNFKDIVKQSYVINDIILYIKKIIKFPNIKPNEDALLALKRATKNKIFVNVVAQKSINSRNFSNYYSTKKLIEFLENNKFNYKWCDIPLDGFHKIDSHPNEKGYITLQKCTEDALKILQIKNKI